MSLWGSLDATFVGYRSSADHLARDMPTGSEGGPTVYIDDDASVYGRLRDVSDHEDSFAILAWFTRHLVWCESATIMWDIDDGPRYRYEWAQGQLRKLRGVLDL